MSRVTQKLAEAEQVLDKVSVEDDSRKIQMLAATMLAGLRRDRGVPGECHPPLEKQNRKEQLGPKQNVQPTRNAESIQSSELLQGQEGSRVATSQAETVRNSGYMETLKKEVQKVLIDLWKDPALRLMVVSGPMLESL